MKTYYVTTTFTVDAEHPAAALLKVEGYLDEASRHVGYSYDITAVDIDTVEEYIHQENA